MLDCFCFACDHFCCGLYSTSHCCDLSTRYRSVLCVCVCVCARMHFFQFCLFVVMRFQMLHQRSHITALTCIHILCAIVFCEQTHLWTREFCNRDCKLPIQYTRSGGPGDLFYYCLFHERCQVICTTVFCKLLFSLYKNRSCVLKIFIDNILDHQNCTCLHALRFVCVCVCACDHVCMCANVYVCLLPCIWTCMYLSVGLWLSLSPWIDCNLPIPLPMHHLATMCTSLVAFLILFAFTLFFCPVSIFDFDNVRLVKVHKECTQRWLYFSVCVFLSAFCFQNCQN